MNEVSKNLKNAYAKIKPRFRCYLPSTVVTSNRGGAEMASEETAELWRWKQIKWTDSMIMTAKTIKNVRNPAAPTALETGPSVMLEKR